MSDYDSATDSFVESKTQKKKAPIGGMSRGLEELGQLRAELDELKKEVEDTTKSKTTTQKKRSEALGGADEDGVFIFTTK